MMLLRGSMRLVPHSLRTCVGSPTTTLLPLARPACVLVATVDKLGILGVAVAGGLLLGSTATPADAMKRAGPVAAASTKRAKPGAAAAAPPQRRIFEGMEPDQEAHALALFEGTQQTFQDLASYQLTPGQDGEHAVEALRHADFAALLLKAHATRTHHTWQKAPSR
eukprot:COSAG04_NODE_535_length_12932_cov_12.604223_6_plen_166_part_00